MPVSARISPLIVALDVENIREVERVLKVLGPGVDFYKVGLRLFTHYGPDILKLLKKKRKKIFLDLKLHDIPNTVAEACREIARHRVQMLTLHASGGKAMMSAAAAAIAEESRRLKIPKPFVMGVTVLTSMENLSEIGVPLPTEVQVLRLAKLASEAKLDGVICSPHEIAAIREVFGKKIKIVTPGVRPQGSESNDQKRVKTPQEAFALGTDSVVVGRPILKAKHPREVVASILKRKS